MKCAIEVYQQELARINETDEDYLNLWLEEPADLPSLEKHYKQTVERQSISCNRFCTCAPYYRIILAKGQLDNSYTF